MNHTQLVKTLDTIIDRLDNIEQRLAAIERAATCGTGPNKPWSKLPAQAGVGEAPAESEWPRYVGPHESSVSGAWANGCILIRFDSASSKGVEIFPSKADKAWYGDWAAMEYRRFGMEWKDVPRAEAEARIAAAKGEKPQTVVEWAESIGVPFPADTDSHGCPVPPRSAPDDQPPFHVGQVVEAINSDCVAIRNGERLTVAAITEDGHLHFDNKPSLNYPAWCFRPIPAPVEQGPTSEGMKAAAENIAKWQLEAGQEQLKFQATCEQFIVTHVGPELAAKDAEIARLQRVAEQLREGQLIDSLYADISLLRPLAEERNSAISRLENLQQQLSAATAAIVERDRAAEAMAEALKPFANMSREDCIYPDDYVVVVRGVASDMTMLCEGDFRQASAILDAKAAAEGNG